MSSKLAEENLDSFQDRRLRMNSLLLILGTLVTVFLFQVDFSVAKQCMFCRGEDCRTGRDRRETCVGRGHVCATWKYRTPMNGAKPGDVYKKGCAHLMVVVDGCVPDGRYERCACRTTLCNDKHMGLVFSTFRPIIMHGSRSHVASYPEIPEMREPPEFDGHF